MATDLSALASLTLSDLDPTLLAERARVDVVSRIPGLTLRVGNVETALIDAFALTVAESVYTLNRVPKATIAGVLTFMGAIPDPGLEADTSVTFNLSSTNATTVPAGTVVRLSNDITTVTFITTTDGANDANTTITVFAVATSVGASWNGTPAGTRLELLSSGLTNIDNVALASPVQNGRDPEDLDSWLLRASNRFARMSAALTTADGFVAYAKETPGVTQAYALDRYDVTDSTVKNGHVSLAVIGPGGVPLSTEAKDALEEQISDLAVANLAVHLVDALVTPVDVTAQIVVRPGYDGPAVADSVVATLASFLDPNTWPFDDTVAVADLVGEINRTAGVQSTTVSVPATDVTLPGFAPLATLGVATITIA